MPFLKPVSGPSTRTAPKAISYQPGTCHEPHPISRHDRPGRSRSAGRLKLSHPTGRSTEGRRDFWAENARTRSGVPESERSPGGWASRAKNKWTTIRSHRIAPANPVDAAIAAPSASIRKAGRLRYPAASPHSSLAVARTTGTAAVSGRFQQAHLAISEQLDVVARTYRSGQRAWSDSQYTDAQGSRRSLRGEQASDYRIDRRTSRELQVQSFSDIASAESGHQDLPAAYRVQVGCFSTFHPNKSDGLWRQRQR